LYIIYTNFLLYIPFIFRRTDRKTDYTITSIW